MLKILFTALVIFPYLVQANVYTFPDKDIHVSLTSQTQFYNLNLSDDDAGGNLLYNPNLGGVVIPRISYKGLWGLSWGFNTPVGAAEKELLGETDYTDIRFDFSFHKFTINTYYSQYSGMYLENSAEVDPAFTNTEARITRPDLYSRSYGASITWVFNEERFSLPNLITQAERQERRGGSWLLGAGFSEARIKADAPLVPAAVQNRFDTLANMTGGKFQTLSVKGGYGYTLAKKWFLGGAFLAGPGLSRQILSYDNRDETKGWEPSALFEVLVSGGYNGDVFFTSMKINATQEFYFLDGSSSQVAPQLGSVGLTIGIHLDTIGM